MSETLTLKPGEYDKLGVLHCGVLRDFLVSCAGDLHDFDDGEQYLFERTGVIAVRDKGEVTFSKKH